MATLREFILSQSSLDAGNTVSDHINNPADIGGGGTGVVLLDGLELFMDDRCLDVEVDLGDETLDGDNLELEVTIEDFDFDIEIC